MNDNADFNDAFFHDASGSVRFWTRIGAEAFGACISRETLHYRFRNNLPTEDPLQTFLGHRAELEDAVRRRAAAGAREPVILREHDLRATPAAGGPG